MKGKAIIKSVFWSICLLITALQSAKGQVVINEICPTNTSLIVNSTGEYDDWMELHNAGSSAVNLNGYGLTDDPTKPFQFTFPSYSLQPGQKVLVFAADKTNKLVVDHWEMAVNAGSIWRYAIGSLSLDTNWRNLSFNESTWNTGYAGIGLGDGDDNTIISATASVMMRKTFSITDSSQILKAVLLMDYDDGFVAYLNGVEIARANIGTAGYRPSWDVLAASSHEAKTYRGLPIDSFYLGSSLLRSALRPGTNVLAIEVHNTPANSDDITSVPYLFFGMSSPGLTYMAIPSWFHVPAQDYFSAKFKIDRYGETLYLNNPSGVTVDQKTFTTTEINHSVCRIPDGSANWCFTATPTPNASNNSSNCYSAYASSPSFSKQGGYYSSAQSLVLTSNTPGAIIRYTTNGNTPDNSSQAYTAPITISSTSTIRARVFANGYLPGPMVTNTYIINGTTHLSTFSITTDSLNLWDYNTGIYVLGPNAEPVTPFKGANYWQDWEKPATIEYFDKNKNEVVKFDASLRIYGNYSRAKPQKSFEIKLKDSYGMGSFIYPIYPDKSYIEEIDNIILRNAGTDWNKVHFRDAFMERMLKSTNSGYLATEPTVAYLNGEYWGVYHINENHDQHWMNNNFGYKRSEIDYLKESGTSVNIQEGSDESFWTLYNYATTQSPASQQYYDYINSQLDLKNYSDYFIAETFYNNGDWIGEWTNNIKLWRPKKSGAKWRYLMYDLDYGLGLKGDVTDNRLAMARNPIAFSHSSEMFDAILKNPTYKRDFINRYCDLMNTIFLPANANSVMRSYKDSMSYDMPEHFAKWGSSTTNWNTLISEMMTFENDRIDIMKDYIKSEFNLSGLVTLTFQPSPLGSGRIEISTVTPTTYPWTGDYYNGNPVTITAIPNPGFTFDHWRSQKVISSNNSNQTVTYNFNRDDVVKAFFSGSAVTPKLCVSELNYNSDSAFDAGDWIELHNYGTTALDISGWKLSDSKDNHSFVFPTGTKIAANGYLVLVEDSNKFKSFFPTVNNRIGQTGFNFSNGGDQIRIFNHANTLYLSFMYQDLAPWPVEADGVGFTCELTSNIANPNNGASWTIGCIGGSPGRAYSTAIMVPLAVFGSTTFCSGSSTVIKAPFLVASTYQWKKSNVNISGAIDSVYSATQSGVYTVSITNHGCTATTSPITLSTVTQQPMPVTVADSRCGPGELTLSGSSSDSIFWYTAATGGTQVAAGNTFHIPFVAQTTTYYARTGRNCPSNSVATTATIMPAAASPVSSDTARCGPGTVTLFATDTAEIRWYNAAVGGGLLATGNSFTSNYLESDTSYFIEAGSVCPSPRIEVRVAVNSTPEPIVSDASRCGAGTITLAANSAASVYWYNTSSGGSALTSGSIFTASLAETDTFYAEASSGCASARVMAIAIINPIPPNPIVTDTTLCSPGSVTLFADATEQVEWYNSASGGSMFLTGPNFTTPVLTSSHTYYVETGYDCKSNRVPVTVTISSIPTAPSGSNVARCDSGSVTLNATSSQPIEWYDSPSGGNLLAAGNAFTTPTLTTTTTYYAEAGSFCKSTRTAVQAIINEVPAPPASSNVSRCGSGSVTLTATSAQLVYWFNSPTGGTPIATGLTFNTPALNASTTYFLETGNVCRSSRISVNAEILPLPASPVLTGASRCGSGTLMLTANSQLPVTWYNVPSGGNAIGTGLTFNTPSLNTTTTYYAEVNDGCVSQSASVQAIIQAIPAAPVTSDVSHCGPGAVTFTASSPVQINWYSSSTGGTPLATGTSFTTPSLTATTTYYAEAQGTCISPRIPVQAIIASVTPAPVLTNASACGTGMVVLNATATSQVNWFNVSSGGVPIGSGLNFTTPNISSTTIFYAEAGPTGCVSPRVSVQAIINAIPSAPATIDASRCGTGSVTLTATSGFTVNWYNQQSGGSSVNTGLTYVTPSLSSSSTYYVEAVSSEGCVSSRTPVQAVIRSIPAVPVASDVTHCGNGVVVLNATSTEQINWFTSSTGGSSIFTGSSFSTPYLSATTTYYAEAGSVCLSGRIPVQAIISASASTPTLTSGYHCGTGSVTLTANSTSPVMWYDSPTGGTLVGTGLSFTTASLNITTTFYAEAGVNGCVSQRAAVQAVIRSLPAAPTVTDDSHCGAGSFTLTASSPDMILWYDSPSTTNQVGSGSTFITPVISTTTTYYVVASNICSSLPVAVNAVVNALPYVNIGPDTLLIPGGQTIMLNAGSGFSSYEWSTGSTDPQIQVSTAGSYSVVVTNSNGCSATDRVFVNMITSVTSLINDNSIRLYPNPASEKVTIELTESLTNKATLHFYSMDGKTIFTEDLEKGNGFYSKVINLSDVANGVYFFEIRSDDYSYTKRIIISK